MKMETCKINYQNCLTNVTNSILKYYNIEPFHETLPELDKYLNAQDYQNIILILYDGLGSNLLRRNLPDTAFLNENKIKDINAVFPPTTVASTTSVLTGLNPCEHGWLGWDMYYPKENLIATMFTNNLKDTNEQASKENLARKYYPYTSIIELINKTTPAYLVSPHGGINYRNLNNMHKKIKDLSTKEGRKFIYAYYEEPDHTMHKRGTDSKKTVKLFQKINNSIEKLCHELTDSLVIVIADHGHLNSSKITLSDYPDLIKLLKRDIALEGRSSFFFTKENKDQEFVRLFKQYFHDDFTLYSKKEVLDNKLFGFGHEHQNFKSCLGDYLAIAKSNKYFRYNEHGTEFVSTHAGLSFDEVLVPLIIWDTKNNQEKGSA